MPPRGLVFFRYVAFVALMVSGEISARAQQTPNQEPLPANPLAPGAEELTLLPDEIILVPQERAPGPRDSRGPLPPFRLKLEPVEIQPVLPLGVPGFADTGTLASALRVRVKKFRIGESRAFSNRELQKVVAPYSNREISSAELEQARQALTVYYVERGFINSGAVLPDQDLKDGVIAVDIVEGRLTDIELAGHWWFRPWWLRSELRYSAGRPLNLNHLKEGLQLLRQNPNIAQINAELMPGGKPGESILKVDVKEVQPFRASLDFSNRRPPSVGAEIVEVNASMLNLTGHNDPISFRYGIAHATSEQADRWEWSGLENIGGAYRFPITPWHTTLEVHASRDDAAIIEEQFQALDITSESKEYGVTLRQPFYESLNSEFAVSLTADKRESATFLLRRPFTLSAGAIDGETEIFVLRCALEFTNRSQQHVLAIRSTFNLGINEFNATRHTGAVGEGERKIPDGQFFSWLGQAQYVRRLFDTDNLAVVRINAQIASDPLLTLEQFSLGGRQSVRGYRENQLLRDNGAFASLEVRVPVWKNKDKAKDPLVTLAPFFDFGFGRDRVEFRGRKPEGGIDDRMETLASIGAGVIFRPWRYVTGEIYWGYALNRDNTIRNGDNLQDYGVHFALSISAF